MTWRASGDKQKPSGYAFPKPNQNNPVPHRCTHCQNKPPQLPVTHSMFPIVAWWVRLEYFAVSFPRSSTESHTHIESLSTVIHFSGNDLLRPARHLSTVSRPSTTTSSFQTTELELKSGVEAWRGGIHFPNNQNIHTKVWVTPLIALGLSFNAALWKRGRREGAGLNDNVFVV